MVAITSPGSPRRGQLLRGAGAGRRGRAAGHAARAGDDRGRVGGSGRRSRTPWAFCCSPPPASSAGQRTPLAAPSSRARVCCWCPGRRSIRRAGRASLPAVLGARATAIESSDEPLTFAPIDVRHPVFRAFGTDGGPSRIGAVPAHGALARVETIGAPWRGSATARPRFVEVIRHPRPRAAARERPRERVERFRPAPGLRAVRARPAAVRRGGTADGLRLPRRRVARAGRRTARRRHRRGEKAGSGRPSRRGQRRST